MVEEKGKASDISNGSVALYFDAAVDYYDELTATEEGWAIPNVLSRMMEGLHDLGGNAIVVGCGTGHDVSRVHQHGLNVTDAIDVSQKMIDACRAKFPGVQYHLHDLQSERLDGLTADLVVCLGVLEFVRYSQCFMENLAHLLNDQGVVIFTYEPHIAQYKPQQQKMEKLDAIEGQSHEGDQVEIYRLRVDEIERIVHLAGLAFWRHELVFAYRDEQAQDIFYGIAACRRAE